MRPVLINKPKLVFRLCRILVSSALSSFFKSRGPHDFASMWRLSWFDLHATGGQKTELCLQIAQVLVAIGID